MRRELLRTGLSFLTLIAMIFHFGAILEPTQARALGVIEAAHLGLSDLGTNLVLSGESQKGKQLQQFVDAHCQSDSHAVVQATLTGIVPIDGTAYFPTEIFVVGSIVDVSDKPPNLEERS
ncbi:hypothetical protein ACVOMV_25910 (plasmid) [Mesorhizobium atlanticum]|uniref:hypothetical protein n=1 Tax=Mesorhizobium atlanticum TaxID=2233532 RepID=UPI0037042710